MKVTLVGFKSVNFKDNDGKKVEGVKIFYVHPDENVVGNACDGKFIQQNVYDSFKISYEQLNDLIDCVISLEFNQYGKVVGLVAA